MLGSTSPYKDATGGRVSEDEMFDGDIKGLSTRESGEYAHVDFELSNHKWYNSLPAHTPLLRNYSFFFGGGGLRSHVNDDFEWNSSLTQAFFFQK